MSNQVRYPGWEKEAGLYIWTFVTAVLGSPQGVKLDHWSTKIMAPNTAVAKERFKMIATQQGMWENIQKFPINLTTDFIPYAWLDEQLGEVDNALGIEADECPVHGSAEEAGASNKKAADVVRNINELKDSAPLDLASMGKNALMKKIIDTKDSELLRANYGKFTLAETQYLQSKITP
jgi:hypothetical protein